MSVSRHTAYNLIGSAIPILLALVTVPAYLRLVGADRYGVLAIAWLLLGYFGLFDLGLGRATSFRIAALRNAPAQAAADTFWAALCVNVAMGAVGAGLLWIASDYFFANFFKVSEAIRPEILASVPLLAASVPIATITGVLTGAMQGREKFLETNVISTVSTILFQILPLGVAWFVGPNLVWLLTAAVAARLAAAAIMGYQCHLEFTKGSPPRLVLGEIPLLLKYGGWVTLTSAFGPLLVVADRFAIGAVLSAAAVTIYTIPFQLAQRLSIVPGALSNAIFPRMSATAAPERDKMGERATTVLASAMTPVVVVAIFMMQPFMELWIGTELSSLSVPVGQILIIGYWFNAFAYIPFTSLQASGRPDLVTKVLMIQIPPYLALLYILMIKFGVIGCAIAFSARCLLDYALLTRAAGGRVYSPYILSIDLALMVSALFFANRFSPTEPGWWLSATFICAAVAVLSWRALPVELRPRMSTLSRLLRGKLT